MITEEKLPIRTLFFRDHEIAARFTASIGHTWPDNSKKRRVTRAVARVLHGLWVLSGAMGPESTHDDGGLTRLITAAGGGYVVGPVVAPADGCDGAASGGAA